ncbi:hypothetical protein LINPERHAP1_LOCUS33881, partial [Linum perenne]
MSGLRVEIQEGVTTADMGSLVAIKAAALQRERLENKKKEEKKRKASAQPSPSVTHSHPAKRAQTSYSGFRGAQSTPQRSVMVCYTCGLPGHKSATCRRSGLVSRSGASGGLPMCGICKKPHFGECHLLGSAPVTCYTCGQPGHKSNFCPRRSIAPAQSVGSVQGPRAPSKSYGGGGGSMGRGVASAGRGTGANAMPVGTGGDQGRLYALT